MKTLTRLLTTPILGASLVLVPVQQASADNGGALLGAAILGAIIAGGANQQKTTRRATSSRSAAAVQADREMQEALNYFGFDAGPEDGAPGRQTRAAVSSFQSSLNHPVTGQITPEERQFLQDARAWSAANPSLANQLSMVDPLGRRGLPANYRHILMNEPVPGMQPQPAAAPVQPQAPAPAPAPSQEMALADDDLFGAPEAPVKSMTDLCAQTSTLTAAAGGPATATEMPDITLALNEQFCLARGYAQADGKQLIDSLAASQQKIDDTCAKLKANLLPGMTGFETKTPDAAVAQMASTVQSKGLTPQKLQTSAQICLSEAYRTDDAQTATEMALALAATGRMPYVELVGHHLREGLGVPANPGAAFDWTLAAVRVLEAGQAPAILPTQSAQRVEILSTALGLDQE